MKLSLEDNEEEGGIPPDAESLLQDSLMKLSLKERNDVQEEIHGVHCQAKEESPSLLRDSLQELDRELWSDRLPFEEKQAFLRSQQLFADPNQPTNHPYKSCGTYVNTEEFRLRFLRASLFDVPKAAFRMCRYLMYASEVFGDFALQRPIQMSDFSKTELREFRKGRYQFLPFRDRAGKTRGRRIVVVFLDEEWDAMLPTIKEKIWLYMSYVAMDEVETQKNGIVCIMWFDKAWKNLSRYPQWRPKTSRVLSVGVRASACHVCTPDTPLFRFRRSLLILRLRHGSWGGASLPIIKMHVANSVENMYRLQSYGIPVDSIPISFSGNIKDKYIKEWIHLRQLIEDERSSWNQKFPTSLLGARGPGTLGSSTMIETPYLDDILFRTGTSHSSHPGNVALRNMIAAKVVQTAYKFTKTQDFAEAILDEIIGRTKDCNNHDNNHNHNHDGCYGRFLFWNEQGWWTELSPVHHTKEIYNKIHRLVRDIRRDFRKASSNHHRRPYQATSSTEAAAVAAAIVGEGPSEVPSSSSSFDVNLAEKPMDMDGAYMFLGGSGPISKKLRIGQDESCMCAPVDCCRIKSS